MSAKYTFINSEEGNNDTGMTSSHYRVAVPTDLG